MTDTDKTVTVTQGKNVDGWPVATRACLCGSCCKCGKPRKTHKTSMPCESCSTEPPRQEGKHKIVEELLNQYFDLEETRGWLHLKITAALDEAERRGYEKAWNEADKPRFTTT